MTIPILQIDAFTDRAFAGNPAAVCLLPAPASAAWMQSLAIENNLSETAYIVRREAGDGFDLRWFTPGYEVELCGHATLAGAHALWESGWLRASDAARFHTLSGELVCTQGDGGWIAMDMPNQAPTPAELPPGSEEALGRRVLRVGMGSHKHIVELENEAAVRECAPDLGFIRRMQGTHGIVVTARSDDDRYDFVSRFFAGPAGIDEDPVCGSAHCALAPYWAEILGKTELMAHQVSARGGALRVAVLGDRVRLEGQAVTTLRGELTEAALAGAFEGVASGA
jgi:PhzF family phenazine biosynthesis protein